MDMSQYLSVFMDESREHLQSLNQCLLKLENNPQNLSLLNEIFRSAHTLKGMSATMGFNKVAELTHEMEGVLDKLRTGAKQVTNEIMDALFECLDTLETLVEEIASGQESTNVDKLVSKLKSLLTGAGKVAAATPTATPAKAAEPQIVEQVPDKVAQEVDLQLNEFDKEVLIEAKSRGYLTYKVTVMLREGCLLKAARVFMVFKNLEEIGEIIKSVPDVKDLEEEKFENQFDLVFVAKASKEEIKGAVENIAEIDKVEVISFDLSDNASGQEKAPVDDQVQPLVEQQSSSNAPATDKVSVTQKKTSTTVRVDIERLDVLMNLVGELVINRTRLEQIGLSLGIADLSETLEHVGRISTELQDVVMKVRMVPVEQVFNRFPRMMRDLAKDLGKEYNLIIEGQETELDRTVIDEIGEPLVHLLRNSADHGIEMPEDRIKHGKPKVGTIRLVAQHEGNYVVIKVEDDGKGINPDIIRKKVVEKKVLSEKDAEKLTDAEAVMMIFAPGFSTVDKATDISGRGVGMDVVKTKIESLGGSIDLDSKVGLGSRFIIKLPLTLAIIQGLLVGLQDEVYAIPLGTIEETISILPREIKTIQNQEVYLLRGNVLPLVRLHDILSVPVKNKRETEGLYIVVVRIGDKKAGFIVDELMGQREIVIKSLGKLLTGIKGLSGATILGDGRVAIILDVATLI